MDQVAETTLKTMLDACVPEYKHRHSGTALVVGTAWNAMTDFQDAMRKHQGTTIIGVNRTGQFINCDMMVSQDRAMIPYWRSVSMNRNPETHSLKSPIPREYYPYIDYFWPAGTGSGTSAWTAAKIALAIGFEEVILCGVPIESGPYIDGVLAPTFDDKMVLRKTREAIMKDTWLHPYVKSMSGWTKEFLGGI